MTDKTKDAEWPPRIPRFVNGVLYSPEQLIALGKDHDFGPDVTFVEGLTGSTPVQNLTKEQIAALAKQHGFEVSEASAGAGSETGSDDPAEMTAAQLRAELVAAGQEPAANAKKDELLAAVIEHRAKA